MRIKAKTQPDVLEDMALQEIRDAADNLREAANALKKIGSSPELMERLDAVSKHSTEMKRQAGQRRRQL